MVPRIPRRPAVFLVTTGNSEQTLSHFPQALCGRDWDATYENFAALRDNYDVCISVDEASDRRSHFRPDLEVLVWCETLQSFDIAQKLTVHAVALIPSSVAILDAQRMRRHTLVVASPVQRGDAISAQDIRTIAGGNGTAAELSHAFLGRRAAYDLVAGETLDFGKVMDD